MNLMMKSPATKIIEVFPQMLDINNISDISSSWPIIFNKGIH